MTTFPHPQLMMLKIVAQSIADKAVASKDETNKHLGFFGLACWMLSQFAYHGGLEQINVTAIYQAEDVHDQHMVHIHHHLKVTAIGADLGLSDPVLYSELTTEIAPLPFLGEGAFTLSRSDELVAAFLEAAVVDNSETMLESIVYRLASALIPTIGNISVVHRLNSGV